MSNLPMIIQGGMGAGVSSWKLARAVSLVGQLGVVSGTGLDQMFARRLQEGDPGGHMRRGLDHFPFPQMAERQLRFSLSVRSATLAVSLSMPNIKEVIAYTLRRASLSGTAAYSPVFRAGR